MIKIEGVSKYYKGMDRPAVSKLDLEIKEGEICVFVGPSGCGKTTTMKMINRIIEPTNGIISIDGKNILEFDADELRLGIGYVIQKVGLFPHYTVFENIAVVPKLKGWKEDKVMSRVRELLDVVDLDPDENMYKYPNQLSGGQKQRVGVARAMAANPSVMLMDEPFGAVDPITRNQLQNEFLALQKKVKMTICFVTHDIDEAIKMGDKIAIMNNGKLVQYDTPENILFSPINEFVEEFVGSDRALKVLNLLRVSSIMEAYMPTIRYGSDSSQINEFYNNSNFAIVLNDDNKLQGYIDINRIVEKKNVEKWCDYIRTYDICLGIDSTLKDAMVAMLENDMKTIPVLDDEKKYIGVVNFDMIKSHVGREYETTIE
ncbi:betaine/proline/choline family ABC transporter ATP-binding protein [Clostridiaceae bacterium HSG29]|nr:betaine/proline/choline family ABC transporter ATP-binding protein [Clostridiaceae bacterium HSG29]